MKRCKVCRKKPRLERRVDSIGNVFCSDDCFDEFEGGPDDFDHPYMDDYESMRRIYSEWMMNYEEDLHKSMYLGYPKKIDLIDWLEEALGPFWDYCRLEGRDGIFSAEIFQYMHELVKLQKTIRSWEPDNRKYEKWVKELQAKKKAVSLP